MVRSGGFRLVIDKWLRLGRQNSLFRRISSVKAEDSAVDKLAVLHILQRDIRGAFRLLGRSGGAELRARHADLFERRGDGFLRLAERATNSSPTPSRRRTTSAAAPRIRPRR